MKKIQFFMVLIFMAATFFAVSTGCANKNDGEKIDVTGTAAQTGSPTQSAETSANDKTEANGDFDEYEFSFSDGIDENGHWEGVKALDHVEIFNYRSMSIPNEVYQVSESEIQSQVSNILASYSDSEQVTDRPVAYGDSVNIDYVGSVDGVEFSGGSTGGMGTDVTAGSTDYIDDFLTQIIGHMPGETINVEVTFPDYYPNNPDLQNKDALFVTTINYITAVTEPELTDDFVAANLMGEYGWTTVDTMREEIRTYIQTNSVQQYIQQYFLNDVTIKSVPEKLITYQENVMIDYFMFYAGVYGMKLEELIGYEGYSSVSELKAANRDENTKGAVVSLVIQAVAEDANISVSNDDLAYYFMEYYGSSDYSTYAEQSGLPYLKQIVLRQKVMDYIIDHAVVG